MSEKDRFQLFLSQIAPLIKESGLPLNLLTDAVELAYIQSGNDDWNKVSEYTVEYLKYSTEQLILIAIARAFDRRTPIDYALSLALRERAELGK